MATQEELYISISPNVYRAGKSNILMGQAELLGILKKLHNLKVISRKKQDLKKRLRILFTSLLSEVNSIQNKMPTSIIPKVVQKYEKKYTKRNSEEKPKQKSNLKSTFSKRDNIEEELKLIQEKLRELNS